MSYELRRNAYGKSQIRLVKVTRQPDRHDLHDVTVSVRFEGDFESVYVAGDNRRVLPTDTMRNTVYALAKKHPVEPIEKFGVILSEHFLLHTEAAASVGIELEEHLWTPIVIGDRKQRDAFMRRSGESRTAAIVHTRRDLEVRSGIRGLMVLKSAKSAFEGYLKDEYTTLKETRDRIFATAIEAAWSYESSDVNYTTYWQGVRQTVLETFAAHESLSVQHTLYAMGTAVLERFPEVGEIRLHLPNKHHIPFDLAPLGLSNQHEVFVATDEPYGSIEATIRRT